MKNMGILGILPEGPFAPDQDGYWDRKKGYWDNCPSTGPLKNALLTNRNCLVCGFIKRVCCLCEYVLPVLHIIEFICNIQTLKRRIDGVLIFILNIILTPFV